MARERRSDGQPLSGTCDEFLCSPAILSRLGVYVTIDGAKSWSYLGSGLPNAPVWDLQVHPRDNRLVIATNGRGMWIIDDVAPIQNAK